MLCTVSDTADIAAPSYNRACRNRIAHIFHHHMCWLLFTTLEANRSPRHTVHSQAHNPLPGTQRSAKHSMHYHQRISRTKSARQPNGEALVLTLYQMPTSANSKASEQDIRSYPSNHQRYTPRHSIIRVPQSNCYNPRRLLQINRVEKGPSTVPAVYRATSTGTRLAAKPINSHNTEPSPSQ
jgi:hypothetical protein